MICLVQSEYMLYAATRAAAQVAARRHTAGRLDRWNCKGRLWVDCGSGAAAQVSAAQVSAGSSVDGPQMAPRHIWNTYTSYFTSNQYFSRVFLDMKAE